MNVDVVNTSNSPNPCNGWKCITVTPEEARDFLSAGIFTRRLRPLLVERYANEMRQGNWYLTHEGICFDNRNRLVDGQHRLSAQVRIGVTLHWWAFFGLGEAALAYVNIGAVRSDADAAKFAGLDLDTKDAAICRMLLSGFTIRGNIPRGLIFKVYAQHRDAIKFCQRHEARWFGSHIRTPVARAWYSQDRDRLDKFLLLLESGVSNGAYDNAAVRLRDLIMITKGGSSSMQTRMMLYRRTERALSAFLSGQPLKKLHDAPSELFALPEEKDAFDAQVVYEMRSAQ